VDDTMALRPRRLKVGDVMTREVVTVGRDTEFKEVERRLAQHHVSALPVVDASGDVVGVVSESDLLLKLETTGAGQPTARGWAGRRSKGSASTAEQLMTSPAITVGAGQPLAAAARLMRKHRVQQLPVVSDGRLTGMLSRGDLLTAFLRNDEEIGEDVRRGVLGRIMWLDPDQFRVSVHDGVVDIAGTVERRSDVAVLVDLVRGVEGVIDVRSEVASLLDDRNLRFPPAVA
jgi:CBS domain-containing protein